MKAAKVTNSFSLLLLFAHQSHAFTCVPRNCNPRTDNNCVCLSPQQPHPSSTARWSPRQRLGPSQALSLFMLPFWASGGLVAKLAFYDPFLGGQLTIGQYAWSLKGTWLGLKKKEKDGATDDLRGAVAEVAAFVNGVPQAELRLYGSKGMVSLGLGLPLDELEYLAGEINQYLLSIRKGGGSDKDMLYEGEL